MVKPEVILWPDPENQWVDVMDVLQESLPRLLVYGSYLREKKRAPAIWLKCQLFYEPWLGNLTGKFQKPVEADSAIFTSQAASVETESFILFVDAFCYELAEEFCERL